MPIKAYVGIQRSGKSYEVVKNVILPALRQGRRVVSNIAGLNYEAFCSILYGEGFSQNEIGQLVCIKHDAVLIPSFWRTDTDNETGKETFIQPGDLIALDEIWRFWKKRGDIEERCMNFMRMHGHMPHPETGLICEIALITQSIRDINENIKEVIQETYQTIKNTKVGSDKSYICHIYQRGSISKADFIRTLPPRFYDEKYFPLYKSHSQQVAGDAAASEKNPDGRSSILKGAFFKWGLPLSLLCCAFGLFFLWRFFHPKPAPVLDAPKVALTVSGSAAVPVPPIPEVNAVWRVSGYTVDGSTLTIFAVNSSGAVRPLVNPPNYKFVGRSVSVLLPEGGFATSWTSFDKAGGMKL